MNGGMPWTRTTLPVQGAHCLANRSGPLVRLTFQIGLPSRSSTERRLVGVGRLALPRLFGFEPKRSAIPCEPHAGLPSRSSTSEGWCILEMPPSEVPGRAVSEDAAASWSAAALCRFAIYAQKTVLTLLAPKPKRQPPSLRYGGPGRAGALQKLRHVVVHPHTAQPALSLSNEP